MTSVTRVTRPQVDVRVYKHSGIMSPSLNTPVTIKSSTGIDSAGASRLDQLTDVVEVSPSTGDVPIYDSTQDKYVVGPVDLDGGTF